MDQDSGSPGTSHFTSFHLLLSYSLTQGFWSRDFNKPIFTVALSSENKKE
uniref:Uncharacterized protein n=1 Tax=Anguilla anguilla TaxID=7936 RepID=A0A0E9XVZ4_ANGAN